MDVLLSWYLKLPFILGEAAPAVGGAPAGGGSSSTLVEPKVPAADPSQSLIQMAVMFLPFIAVIYFFMWRPESKRRAEREQVLNSLKVKDKVVTIGGLLGTVLEVEKDEVLLLVDPKKDIRMRFRRSAIDVVESNQSATEEKK